MTGGHVNGVGGRPVKGDREDALGRLGPDGLAASAAGGDEVGGGGVQQQVVDGGGGGTPAPRRARAACSAARSPSAWMRGRMSASA